jgi:hypothetical protein
LELDGAVLGPAPVKERVQRALRAATATIFKHACALGCEHIVSKRLGSAYRSCRVDHRVKIKNLAAPAAKREEEEDWDGDDSLRATWVTLQSGTRHHERTNDAGRG